MRNIKMTKNPFLLFLPFLFLYIFLVIIFPTHGNSGDENRYLMFANHMLHGFYSYPYPNIDIGDGPGYPILILPFRALKVPLIYIALLNAFLYYFSIILLYKTLIQIASIRRVLVICFFWACFYSAYDNIPLILPETFTTFLVVLLIFNVFESFSTKNKKNSKFIVLSGLNISLIALTKIIFGYVLLFMLAISIVAWLIRRQNNNYKKTIFILFIALFTTFPYLIYTYHITGRIFYWGTTGGENLYWMSSPLSEETGSWIQYPIDPNIDKNTILGADSIITLNHRSDFVKILKFKGVERDSAYMQIAIENIKLYPTKFIKNCFSNIGRILFNYPYSYTIQKNSTLFRLPLNGIILVCILFCIIPTIINWKKIMFPVRFLLLFITLYFSASILASAETRMFTVIVPILLFWIAFIYQKMITINLKDW